MRKRLAILLARTPVLGKLYVRGMLRVIERAPKGKLPPELRQLQAMIRQIPKEQRVPLLQAAMRGELPQPQPGEMSRKLRRAAAREARRRC